MTDNMINNIPVQESFPVNGHGARYDDVVLLQNVMRRDILLHTS